MRSQLFSQAIVSLVDETANFQPQASACFENERDLVEAFEKALEPNWGFGISAEFDCTHGIADLVLYKPAPRLEQQPNIRLLPAGWTYALRLLPYRKTFTSTDFRTATSASAAQAQKILKRFEEAGFVRKGRKCGTWVKFRQPRAIVKEIIAVEAKLTKWRQALQQATRYQHFAHCSWVVLDQESTQVAINNIFEFRRFNVGLASVSTSGELKIYHKPTKKTPKSPMLFWMANVKIASRL